MNKKFLGWFLILGFCSMYLMAISITSPSKLSFEWDEMDLFKKIISIWGLCGGFTLWFWMLGSHFKGNKTNYPVLWGFILIFGNIIAATLYFIFIYSSSKGSANVVS